MSRTADERLDALESAVLDLAELIRDMGQVLSWTSAGQRLNNPPQTTRAAQERIRLFHYTVNAERLAAQRERARCTTRLVVDRGFAAIDLQCQYEAGHAGDCEPYEQ